nr:MAG TPA: hypothetical protein [Caudoviricetes sp.]
MPATKQRSFRGGLLIVFKKTFRRFDSARPL